MNFDRRRWRKKRSKEERKKNEKIKLDHSEIEVSSYVVYLS